MKSSVKLGVILVTIGHYLMKSLFAHDCPPYKIFCEESFPDKTGLVLNSLNGMRI